MSEGGWSSGTWGQAAWGGSVYARAQADSARVAENIFVAGNTFRPAISERNAVTDLSAVTSSTYRSQVSETSNLVESLNNTGVYRVSNQDTVRATQDRFSAQQLFDTRLVESVTAQDTAPATRQVFNSVVNEQSSTSDVPEGKFQYDADVAEQARPLDVLVATGVLRVQQVDTARITDNLSAQQRFRCTMAEQNRVTDLVVVNGVMFVRIDDTVQAYDQINQRLLWELIDDANGTVWGEINTQTATAWSPTDTSDTPNWQSTSTAV